MSKPVYYLVKFHVNQVGIGLCINVYASETHEYGGWVWQQSIGAPDWTLDSSRASYSQTRLREAGEGATRIPRCKVRKLLKACGKERLTIF